MNGRRSTLILTAALGLFAALASAPASAQGCSGQTCNGLACTICGTDGNNILSGTSAADVICGLGGADVISGGGGNDNICGGDGADKLATTRCTATPTPTP
jgi:Ca2+-binding RTX toxin-like protein